MDTKRLPQLVLFDGATGAGKSTLLGYLRDEYRESVLVGAKLTTRKKRTSDNEWEFRFVKRIPEPYTPLSFGSVGSHYAIDYDQLVRAVDRRLIYSISCVDRRIIEILASDFITCTIYVYRSWTDIDLEALLISRGISDQFDAQLRRDEVASIAQEYLQKIDLYDHVLLNIGSKLQLIEQLAKILQSYGISGDTPNRERSNSDANRYRT